MAAQKSSRLTAIRARSKRIWSELDYANRRMFDIRTGEHFMESERKGTARAKESRSRASRRATVPAH